MAALEAPQICARQGTEDEAMVSNGLNGDVARRGALADVDLLIDFCACSVETLGRAADDLCSDAVGS